MSSFVSSVSLSSVVASVVVAVPSFTLELVLENFHVLLAL